MKQSQFYRLAIVGVLWLSIGAGCQKDPPLPKCDNGSCCWKDQDNKFIKRINNVPANFDGISFGLKEAISEFEGRKLTGAIVCENQWEQIGKMNLGRNVIIDPITNKVRLVDSTRQYPYRLWGIVYEVKVLTITGAPLYSVYVDKVEKAQ